MTSSGSVFWRQKVDDPQVPKSEVVKDDLRCWRYLARISYGPDCCAA